MTSTSGKVKKLVVQASVIRASGKREDLGVIGYYHRNPIMRFLHSMKRTFLKLVR